MPSLLNDWLVWVGVAVGPGSACSVKVEACNMNFAGDHKYVKFFFSQMCV